MYTYVEPKWFMSVQANVLGSDKFIKQTADVAKFLPGHGVTAIEDSKDPPGGIDQEPAIGWGTVDLIQIQTIELLHFMERNIVGVGIMISAVLCDISCRLLQQWVNNVSVANVNKFTPR